MSADLLRQRRNLIIISLSLVVIYLTEASFKHDVTVFGAAIDVKNPQRLIWGAWIFWGYFLLRYWQYFIDEVDLGIKDQMQRWIGRKVISYYNLDTKEHYSISWINLRWYMRIVDPISSPKKELNSSFNDNLLINITWTLASFIHVSVNTPRFTDYLLPFLIASMPLILLIIKIFR